MGFQIEIVEGHDPTSYFWFRPVVLKEEGKILWDEVVELEDEFSIEEGDVECFLSYFFYKYFDENLTYNKRRYESDQGYIHNFEWYLTHNFYTYGSLRKMTEEIAETAKLLEIDYENPKLDEVKKRFSIFYMCDQNDNDYISRNNAAIKNHIAVVIDFYKRFISRLEKMMDNNQNAAVISIMGP